MNLEIIIDVLLSVSVGVISIIVYDLLKLKNRRNDSETLSDEKKKAENVCENSVVKWLLDYREDIYKQIAVINGLLGDEEYVRINTEIGENHSEKYGVKKHDYFCKRETAINALEKCLREFYHE